MVHEFAVEPQLLNRWDRFRYLVEKFSVSQGRLMSRFPKKWKKMVYEALTDCGDIEKARIEERLRNIDHRLIHTSRSYDAAVTWLQNAEVSHQERPFRAILATTNPRACSHVLDGMAVDETDPLWCIADPPEIPRLASEIARALAPVISLGDVVVLIDPYARTDQRRYANPLAALLNAARRTGGTFPKRIELLIGLDLNDDSAPALDWIIEVFERTLPNLVPVNAEIKVKILTQRDGGKKLHNRYLLTDLGGIKIDPGFDEGQPGESYELIRLSEDLYQTLWQDYASDQPAFDCIAEISISGNRTSG